MRMDSANDDACAQQKLISQTLHDDGEAAKVACRVILSCPVCMRETRSAP